MSIKLSGVCKRFGAFVSVDNVDLDIAAGELVALLGPSGSGKTTLLRIIAGLEAPDAGSVAFHGDDATDKHARERQVGFVFQHYALFQWDGPLLTLRHRCARLEVSSTSHREEESA